MSIPRICDRPVTPGLRLKMLLARRSWISSNCEGRHGRGPTNDICPHKIFHNCGSSSIFVIRTILPAFRINSWPTACDAMVGVSVRMVRIFRMRKGFSFCPIRHCRKNGLVLASTAIGMAAIPHKTKAPGIKIKVIARSNARLANIGIIFGEGCYHVPSPT